MTLREYVVSGVLAVGALSGGSEVRVDCVQSEVRVAAREPSIFRRVLYEGIAVTSVTLFAGVARAYGMLEKEESERES
ncbi:MAG: hypothetical protein ABIH92_02195 [Nanoarchaeota archaeon]